jgi:hypothetical protein
MSSSRIESSPLGNHYNLSANALRNVAHALVFGSSNTQVPYNDSKVTLLLREFLGGFGRTSILFHLSPAAKNISATLESVRMAKLLLQIENSPHCHPDPSQMAILKRLDELE